MVNNKLTKHEVQTKKKYEKMGYFVYKSYSVFGYHNGLPDFRASKEKLLFWRKHFTIGGRPQRAIYPIDGFFIECKTGHTTGEKPYWETVDDDGYPQRIMKKPQVNFHGSQRKKIKYLERRGYVVVIECDCYPDKQHYSWYFK